MNTPIMSLQTGAEIAQSGEPIIDPRYLRIHAFYCQGSRLDNNPSILHVDDIREISNRGFIVDSANNLMPPDDLVRLKEVLDFHFSLDNKQVIDDDGRKIGKVGNYVVDATTFYITQLGVVPTFWRALGTTEIPIDRTQIVEVTDKHIIVKSPKDKATATEAAPKRIVENPFRHHPQPDAPLTVSEDK
jgi:sporulation protein YlmC with PRC-barrel domain